MGNTESEINRLKAKDFVYPFCLSLGVSILFFIGSNAVMGIDVFDLDNIGGQSVLEWIIILIATFACTAPLYFISSKLYLERIKFNDIKDNFEKIRENLTKPLIKEINEIDSYNFKDDRHTFYINQLKKISLQEDNFIYNVLFLIVSSWKVRTTNKRTELSRILVQRQLDELKKSIDNNELYFSLSSYLNFILDLIEVCFQFEGTFIYHSFTNATPSDWFDGNNQDLKRYREQFSELLKKGEKENILRRTVLCYESESKNKIKSKEEIEQLWSTLPEMAKNIYLKDFVKNHDSNYLIINDALSFEHGFTELIYLGYFCESDNKEKWKWCLVTLYDPESSAVKFRFHNLKSDEEMILLKGKSDSGFTNKMTHQSQRELKIGLSGFMELVTDENHNYIIDQEPILSFKKFILNDADDN